MASCACAAATAACSDGVVDLPAIQEACARQAEALCARIDVCSTGSSIAARYGDLATCQDRLGLQCTAALTARGSSASLESARACAVAAPAASCGEIALDGSPAVCAAAAGQRADGASCRFSAQCKSAFCGLSRHARCGICIPPPMPGSPCLTTSCPRGLYCAPEAQVCVVPAVEGAACDRALPCRPDLSCVAGTCQPSVAASFAAAGEPCGDAVQCSRGGLCVAGLCQRAADDQAPCDISAGPLCVSPALCVVPLGGGSAGLCQLPDASACLP